MASPRVLLLDLSLDPSLYRPVAHWQGLLGALPLFALRADAFGSGADLCRAAGDFTHLLVSGSEASIVEPLPWFDPAEALIREAVEAGKPLLGSCFGHQLIARALLGPRHVRRAAAPELGWLGVEDLGLGRPFGGEPRTVWMFACHFDEVCLLPPDWRVLARSDRCAVHAYAVTDRPIWGVQAHPEIDPQEGAALLEGFAARKPDLVPLVRAALAGPRRDDGFGAHLVTAFLEACP